MRQNGKRVGGLKVVEIQRRKIRAVLVVSVPFDTVGAVIGIEVHRVRDFHLIGVVAVGARIRHGLSRLGSGRFWSGCRAAGQGKAKNEKPYN
ncbi:hypothetical protein SDC9_81614 [bioreactor metagenome]|uniref:Uncharacterized protein n=1 Tax=bioreactor metagenome TaxID=1076179 RepID=A0A644ZAV8_9ZZZZ